MAFLIGAVFAIVLIAFQLQPAAAIALGAAAALVADRADRLETRLRRLEQADELRRMPFPLPPGVEPRATTPPPAAVPPQPYAPTLAGTPWVQPPSPPPVPVPPHAAGAASAMAPAQGAFGQPPPSRPWDFPSFAEVEQLLAGRLLAVVGGIALVAGVVFFLGLAFSRGWIGPEARVVLGLLSGSSAFVAGAVLFGGRQRIVGHVLLACGLAAVSLSLYAATRLYGLIGVDLALVGSLVSAGAASLVALHRNSQLVAAYGLVAVLAAPPLMDAPADLLTVAFLGTALLGLTILAVARDWRWLPPTGFVLVGPQLASYLLADPQPAIALASLAGFWALNVVAASGEELRRRRGEPSPTSATVFLASAAFLVWGGFEVLEGALEPARGVFLVAVAAAHLGIGALFAAREHDRHAYALLALGTGVAALTMAVPIQLGGPPVPIAWAAEAAGLAWVAAQRRHPYSAVVATCLFALAIGHLVALEYPIAASFDHAWLSTPASALPFVSDRGGALAFVLGAMVAAGWFARDRSIRLVIAGVGVTLVVYAVGFELRPLGQLTAWAGLATATALVMRRALHFPLLTAPPGEADERAIADRAPYVAAGIAALATLGVIGSYLPLDMLAERLDASARAVLSLDRPTMAAGVLVVAALVTGFGAGPRSWRVAGVIIASTVLAWALPFDLPAAATMVAWAALGAVLLAGYAIEHAGAYRVASATLAAATLLVGIGSLMRPDRLLVDSSTASILPFANPETIGMAAAIALLVVIFEQDRAAAGSRLALGVAATTGVYVVSVGVVDLFQARVGGDLALEELQKQSQVALSVLWAVIGGGALALGLALRQLPVRAFGFALLALATTKVFILDLATLDVAYRVLAFIGLGLLLLASAWVVFRLQPWEPRTGPEEGGA
jgi:uncharacterized membrane protein